MSEPTRARIRQIGQTGYRTPLLVPSYSSRGFSPIKRRFELFSPHTTHASLVSAYDIFYDALPLQAAYGSDLVVLDSGGYEGYSDAELASPKSWTIDGYRSVLAKLENRTTIVPVSFDYNNRVPTQQQLDVNHRLAEEFSQFPFDCLIKPESNDYPWVNVDAIVEAIPAAPVFALFGFTEAELGRSMLERARNIRRIRDAFDQSGRDSPIHVFGCLDPLAIRCYFAAGADVFDGLQWLRSVMVDEGLFRMSTRIYREGLWDKNEPLAEAHLRVRNLDVLAQLQRRLVEFAESRDANALGLTAGDGAIFSELMRKLYGGDANVRG